MFPISQHVVKALREFATSCVFDTPRRVDETINRTQIRKYQSAPAICGLKYSTFRRLAESGKIAFYRFGKIKLFKISELEGALEAYRVATTSEVLS